MSVVNKVLIDAGYVSDSLATKYTATSVTAIIDKFTATNTDSNARTLSVHLVPSGGSADATNIVTSELSIAAGASVDLPEMKNHVLEPGDFIAAVGEVASKIVVRASGREVT